MNDLNYDLNDADAMKIMFYIRCYLTKTTMVMNFGTDAMNALSHPMMTNATLQLCSQTVA